MLLAGGALTWLLRPTASDYAGTQAVLSLIVFSAMAAVLALTIGGRAVWAALGAVAVITASAFYAHFTYGSEPFAQGGWNRVVGTGWTAFALVLFSLFVIARLVWVLLGAALGPSSRIATRTSWWWIVFGVVALVSFLLVAQVASGAYSMALHQDDISRALNPALFDPWQYLAVGQLVFFPFEYLSLVADLMALLGLAIVLALLSTAGQAAKTKWFDASERGCSWLFLLAFAAFVVGTQGTYFSWTAPVAFVVALALAALLTRWGVKPPSKPPERGSDEALPFGPGESWWWTARIATHDGLVVAIAPLLFFAYVFFSKSLVHDVSPWNIAGLFDVLRSVVHELLFWAVAAFCLGGLFAWLPGRWGAVRGALLGLLYGAAQAFSVWLLPVSPGDWMFRAFELLVFLVVVGVVIDWRTLQRSGRPASDLIKYYRVNDLRFTAGYASAAIGSLVLISQQLQSGHAQNAIVQVVKNLPTFIPPTH
jgi:hypothetical protein